MQAAKDIRLHPRSRQRAACRCALISLLALFTACTAPPELPPPPTDTPLPAPEPAPLEPAPSAGAHQPSPVEPPPLPPARPRPVAIVVSSGAPAYRAVAAALAELPSTREQHFFELDGGAADLERSDAAFSQLNDPLAVAVGLPAARWLETRTGGPIIFCQVFNHEGEGLGGGRFRGVAALPPLRKQIAQWKDLSPDLARVGVILGAGHRALLAEARAATREAGVHLEHRIAGSDREALYLFKRLAPEIDGLWLFPDNRVLSAPIIRELLSYALRRDVQVVVFNPALLRLGGLMSASAKAEDVAATVHNVLDTIARDGIGAVPPITPLSDLDVRLNAAAAEQLGVRLESRLVRSP